MGPSGGAVGKKGITLAGTLVVGILCACVVYILDRGITGAVEQANRAQCANNLSQIGKACQTYAASHRQRWPDVFASDSSHWNLVGNTRTDRWDPVANRGRPPRVRPGDNDEAVESNTANLWLLMASMGLSREVMVCPSSNARVDAVPDPMDVRDFRGETFVSYSYQNVLGDYRLTSTIGRASTMAIAADASPLRRDFRTSGIGEKKREGVTDLYLANKPKFVGEEDYIYTWNAETGGIAGAWELNSPNHQFEGQNVLYLDGHVEWKTHPYSGPNWDNIWLARKPEDGWTLDARKIETLRHYNDPASYNGRFTLPADSTGDSFLVP